MTVTRPHTDNAVSPKPANARNAENSRARYSRPSYP
jgi:hypothetical protein